jgi:hypothetical protein
VEEPVYASRARPIVIVDEVDALVPKVQQATVAALKSLEFPVDKERGDKLGAELESGTPLPDHVTHAFKE